MGGSFGPVLGNIILTEFERIIISPLISSGIIEFYCHYVDDALLLIKHDDIDMFLHKFHSFDNNIRFTYDKLSDEPPHFLHLNLDDNKFSLCWKHTFTGQYTPWKHRIAWIRSLLSRIHKICSPTKLSQETETNDNRSILWLEMPYIGTKGEQLLRSFKKKLLRCLNVNVQIKTRITTTKLNLFTNTKDKVPKQNKSNVVYKFTCPKCNSS